MDFFVISVFPSLSFSYLVDSHNLHDLGCTAKVFFSPMIMSLLMFSLFRCGILFGTLNFVADEGMIAETSRKCRPARKFVNF